MSQAIHKADPKSQEISVKNASSYEENDLNAVESSEASSHDLNAIETSEASSNDPETPEETLERLREAVLEDQILEETQENSDVDMTAVSETPKLKGYPKLQAMLCGLLGIVGIVICIAMNVYGLAALIAIFSVIIAICLAKASKMGTTVSCALMILAIIGYMIVGMSHIGKTRCCDGTWSDSAGRGACSHHGGVCTK